MEHEQGRPKRRKCGPRVKTGCITCRIRRVKCDEAKPDCQRCISTGRKCDGYVVPPKVNNHRSQLRPNDEVLEVVQRPGIAITSPFDPNDTQRSRQLFHFYCVQSAFDLSVYLNSGFWHDMILQYSHHHPVVRQAVVAFGSSHMYALSMNQNNMTLESSHNAIEQVRQYDRALRSLREYMQNETRPDPHVILMCCALFFSCENARGNREAAWRHLENGLHILNSIESNKSKKLLKSEFEVTEELELVASRNGSKLKAKTEKVDVDEELVYVFSRLDVQATLCKETRKPILNIADFSNGSTSEPFTSLTSFSTITEAQRCLDYIQYRLARFLSNAANASHQQDVSLFTPEPDWIENERIELNELCAAWESCMYSFVSNQTPSVKQNLQTRRAPKPSTSPEWQLALQIQLLTLHHRCWWMLFRSYHNPSTFTMSPNPRATEVLDICEFLAFALPVRPSAVYSMSEADIAWKMISEIGVTAPLFVLATKCTDKSIRTRAIEQLTEIRQHGNGMYHETFLDQVIQAIIHPVEADRTIKADEISVANETALNRVQQSMRTPCSDLDSMVDGTSLVGHILKEEPLKHEEDPVSLLGWSKASPAL